MTTSPIENPNIPKPPGYEQSFSFWAGSLTSYLTSYLSRMARRANLSLPKDGSEVITGDIDWDGNDITDFGSISGSLDNFLSGLGGAGPFQPLDADLTAIAALANTDGNFIVGTGSTWTVESGATARASLDAAGLSVANTFTQNNTFNGRVAIGGSPSTYDFLIEDNAATPDMAIVSSGIYTPTIITDSGHTSAGDMIASFMVRWDGTDVAQLRFEGGADNINRDDGRFRLRTASAGTLADRMIVLEDGKVGFGPNTPAVNHHVNNTTSAFSLYTVDGSGHTNSDGLFVGYVNSALIWNYENTSMGFATNNTQHMTLDSSGQLGLGNTTPAAQLEVRNNSATPDFYLKTDGAYTTEMQVDADRAGAGQGIFRLRGYWNETQVAEIRFNSGADTTNKDDGRIVLRTAGAGSVADAITILEDQSTEIHGDLIIATKTPSSASDTGTQGEIAWDSSYIYIATGTNTWKRVAISTW